jgi:hypothetical protein
MENPEIIIPLGLVSNEFSWDIDIYFPAKSCNNT